MGVKVSFENAIAVIAINRVEARNSVNAEVAQGIAAAVAEIERRPDIKVGVLTGEGGTFCAGMDLKAFLAGEIMRFPETGFAGLTGVKLSKPFIAAVEGYALAGGFELALACDFIVAAQTAKFGLPEVKRGLVANAGGLLRLPRQIPQRIAAELVLTGDMYDAATLFPYGLINRLVPEGETLSAALELAGKLVRNGPLAMAVSKQVLRESPLWGDDMFERQYELTGRVFTSQDAREGAAAFAEKREPVWQGR
ncbi:MAG: crotonase/enoyl-CoA hydratase family protein [Blastomonas sp.]|jgi:enoyl-CoA hydratase